LGFVASNIEQILRAESMSTQATWQTWRALERILPGSRTARRCRMWRHHSVKRSPAWCRLKFRSRRLPAAWDGITIAQFSAFHYDDRFSVVPLRKAIDVVNRLRPNSLVLTEDLCSSSLQEIST